MKQSSTTAKRAGWCLGGVALLILGLWWWEPYTLSAEPARMQHATQMLQGKVVRVADGDTVTLQVGSVQHRIRLASIDAPETHKNRAQPGQPYAQAARDFLTQHVVEKNVVLTCYEEDRYGRKICDLSVAGQETSMNRLLVEAGLAWANQEKQGLFLRDAAMLALQQQAQQHKRGLWQAHAPIAPWVWRYQCWQRKVCD